MLIDGKLVDASNGATFDNVNPATEEVLGVAADATEDDLNRAVAAARRAFDQTDWSTNRELRARCLEQLKAALEEVREELRPMIVAETGSPVALTYVAQLDEPINSFGYWIELAKTYKFDRAHDPDGLARLDAAARQAAADDLAEVAIELVRLRKLDPVAE
jgi:aldehyde dehydrogenase (NAD+)